MSAPRVWLVGENNPYSDDPRSALFPHPPQSAGARLCEKVLGMRRSAYLAAFERRNLLSQSRWSAAPARVAAGRIKEELRDGDVVVMLGARVAAAFGHGFRPFAAYPTFFVARCIKVTYVTLPHPSGRSREWNEPGAYERARKAVSQAAPHLLVALGAVPR